MAKIECEICGFSLIKTSKYFVCENCGACYSTEYLKELLNSEEKQTKSEIEDNKNQDTEENFVKEIAVVETNSDVVVVEQLAVIEETNEKGLIEEALVEREPIYEETSVEKTSVNDIFNEEIITSHSTVEGTFMEEVSIETEMILEETSDSETNDDLTVEEEIIVPEISNESSFEVSYEHTIEEKPKVKKKNFFLKVKDFLYKVFVADIENNKLKKAISIVGLIATILFIMSIMVPNLIVLYNTLESIVNYYQSPSFIGHFYNMYYYLEPFDILSLLLKIGLGISLILYLFIPKLRKNPTISKILFLVSLYLAVSSFDITFPYKFLNFKYINGFVESDFTRILLSELINGLISKSLIIFVFFMYYYFRQLSGFSFKSKTEKNIYDYILLAVVYGVFGICMIINLFDSLTLCKVYFEESVSWGGINYSNYVTRCCYFINDLFIMFIGVQAFTLVFVYRKRISSILVVVFGSTSFLFLISKGLFLNFVNISTGEQYTLTQVIEFSNLNQDFQLHLECIPSIECNVYFIFGIIFLISVVGLYVLRGVMSKKSYLENK